MSKYKIICYRSALPIFRENLDDYIKAMPGSAMDQFALLMGVGPDGTVGFDATAEGDIAMNSLISKCYSVDLSRLAIVSPEANDECRMPRLLFRDREGEFTKLRDAHERYELALKKYKVISKYREVAAPEKSILSTMLTKDLPIEDVDLYRALLDACHYVIVRVVSGEHGSDAFVVFSRCLNYFFTEFSSIVSVDAELTCTGDASKLIYY
jgi:hypothetical protein